MNQDSDVEAQVDYQHLPFEFRGNAKEFFGIWIVNVLLTILTLGIYTAWAKVRTKRYFYGNTTVDNSAFDYLANPVTILKGWLIAVLFFILYSVVTNIIPSSVYIFMVLFLLALPWLVIRSLAFRARNTAYRNIRFHFNEDYSDAIKVFIGLSVLMPLTLGLIYPYAMYRQKQFILDNSGYGTSPFSFYAQIKDFYKVYAVVWIGSIAVFIALYMTIFQDMGSLIASMEATENMNQAEPDPELIKQLIAYQFGIMAMMGILLLFAYAFLQARIQNIIWNNAELDNNRFNSTIRVRDLMWIYFSNTLVIIFSFGLMVPWAKVRLARYRLNHLSLLAKGNLDSFVAKEGKKLNAMGEEVGEVFDFDIGI
jgi:uncharacterized membrane protein YjgN (DUF898 family)